MTRILAVALGLTAAACGNGGAPLASSSSGTTGDGTTGGTATGGTATGGTNAGGTTGSTTGSPTGSTTGSTGGGVIEDGGPYCAQAFADAGAWHDYQITCTPLPVDGGCAQRFVCQGLNALAELNEWAAVSYSVSLPGDADMTLSIQPAQGLAAPYLSDVPATVLCSSLRNSCCPSPAAIEASGAYLIVTAEPTLGCATDGGPLPTLDGVSAVATYQCGC